MNISNSRTTASLPAQSVLAANGVSPAKAMNGRSVAHAKAPQAPPKAGAPSAQDTGGELTDRTSGLARLDGVAQAIMERVRNAALDGPEGQENSFREAAEFIEHGLERLRNGYADGTLGPQDIDRGFGNLFQGATDIMNAGRDGGLESPDPSSGAMSVGAVAAAAPSPAPTGATEPEAQAGENDGDTEMAAAVRDRLSSFVDHATERALNAGYPDDQREAVAEAATAIFNQAAERLENAVFNPGNGDPIDRDGLASLFQATFTALQGQIQSLLGDQPQTPAAIYGPSAGAESISSPVGHLDYAG